MDPNIAPITPPVGGDTSTPVASPTPTPSPAATPQVTPPSATASPAQAPATGAPGSPPQEGWVPSYRIREAREAAVRQAQEEFSRKEADYRAQVERIQSQLHALVGVTPPQNPEIDTIKQQFAQVFGPGALKLFEKADTVMELLERSGDLESQNQHYWQSYGRQQMDRLFGLASETFGQPITDEAKRSLHSSFIGWVQSSPELVDRYSSDPSIVEEFWKAFSSTFIDPIRRNATVSAAGRAGVPLPQDTSGGAPRPTPAPHLGGLDERANAGWTQYQTTAKPR